MFLCFNFELDMLKQIKNILQNGIYNRKRNRLRKYIKLDLTLKEVNNVALELLKNLNLLII